MKNILRFFFMTILLFTVISCSQNIENTVNEKKSLEFSFRAGAEFVGTELEVTVFGNGTKIKTEGKTITASDKIVTFSFDDIDIGTKLDVTAVLKRDKTVLFKGTNSIEVVSGENVISLALKPVGVSLSLSPKNLNLSSDELDNADFKVVVNGEAKNPVKIHKGDSSVKADIGYVSIGSDITISATIEKNGVVLYKIENYKHKVKESDSVIAFEMKPVVVSLSISPKKLDIPAEELNGSEFKVTVNGKAAAPVKITSGDTVVKTDIGYVVIGSEITISAAIEKDGVVLYKIDDYKHKVLESDSVISLDLVAESVPLSVSLNASNLPVEELDGKDFKVYVDDIEKASVPIKGNSSILSADIGSFAVGSKLNVSIKIMTGSSVVYKIDNFPYEVKGAAKIEADSAKLSRVSVPIVIRHDLAPDVDFTDAIFKIKAGESSQADIPINPGDAFVSFDMGYVAIGTEVPVTGFIEKDGKKLYEGSVKHIVAEQDREITLTMAAMFADFEVVPSNQISTAIFDGAKINVSVNGVASNPVTITKDGAIPSVNIGRHFFGDTVNIDVKIQKDVQDAFSPDAVQNVTATYFTYSQPYVVKKGENKINLNLEPYTGTVLWGADLAERKMMIRYEDLPTDKTIGIESGLPGIYVSDIAFGPDGDLWVFNVNNGAFQVINYIHGFYPGVPSGFTYYELSTLPELQNDNVEPYYVNDITYYDNGLLLSACPRDGGTMYKLTKAGSGKFDSVKMKMTPPSGLTSPDPVCSITSGNTIYTAFVTADPNKSFHIYKGTISGVNITYDATPLINSATYAESGKTLFADSDFIVTDMQLIGDTLYALVCDVKTGPTSGGYGSNHSRGALIEIASNGTVKVVGLHENKLNTGDIANDSTVEDSNRIYMLNSSQTELIGSNFVGPRKFIAIKPKKLVIADAGAIKVGTDVKTDEKKLMKRIITVNLEDNFNFESIINCKEKSFNGSFSSGYAYAGEF